LVERLRDVNAIDLAQSDAAGLPRPTARSFAQATRKASADLAGQVGADLVLDGGGGDNVFCSLQSARPAADCLLFPAGRAHFFVTVSNTAELTQVSAARVAWHAWRIARRQSPAYRIPVDERFLSAKARAWRDGALRHPWLDAPKGALPGAAAHIALITMAQSVVEDFDPRDPLPLFSPLISQPVVEACLRVPSWLWIGRGINRAIARRAFSGVLPAGIIERRSKATPDSFIIETFEERRDQIRAMLLDGWLAAAGLLDLPALSLALDDPRPAVGWDFFRIMRLVDAEAWARSV
jgi:asparagine synthase (glutamine-hydrolysing)